MISDVLAEAKEKMAKAVDVVHEDFQTVRTGRANPALFQKIMVEYYGQPTPLAQLASLQNVEARTIVVTPYDKSAMKDIEKAITNFPNLGASPSNDGEVIRVTMPELTEDRRKEYVKIVRQKAEDGRVSVRSVRRKAKDDLDALTSEVGEDDVSRAEKELEALTKTHIDQIEDALKKKEAELLEV
ncbi:MAG: ribosome recycling factor [Pontimonas sp.]|jgi:ribosome recycling factor|nr:ribosome recycling factor [Pontimonas sp.]